MQIKFKNVDSYDYEKKIIHYGDDKKYVSDYD